MTRPLSLALYAGAASLVSPLVPALLRARARRGKEDSARLNERLGVAGRPRPPGPLVWLHAVSVGEALSLLPMIEAFAARRSDLTLLATTGTRTAAEILTARLPPGAIHQYAPVDTPRAAARFIAHWRPDLGVLVESELWPNLIGAARAHGTRLALVSAGLSLSSFDRWRAAPAAARTVLGAFALILARDTIAETRLRRLGADVAGLADLKFGAAPLPADAAALAALRADAGDRPIILAASTHPGEERPILEAFADLARHVTSIRLIIAPRHPVRGPDIAAQARERGFKVARRGAGEPFDAGDVYVADTLGEMGLWYRLARAAVIGGSLVPDVGGHNPLEAARLDCPLVAGPYVEKWPVYRDLLAADAMRGADAGDLGAVLASVLADPDAAAAIAARAARLVADRDRAAVDAIALTLALAPT